MTWPWWRRRQPTCEELQAAKRARVEAEARLRSVRKLTPLYEQMAPLLASLPPEEFAERVRRAFGPKQQQELT